jgi:hypothetical protein
MGLERLFGMAFTTLLLGIAPGFGVGLFSSSFLVQQSCRSNTYQYPLFVLFSSSSSLFENGVKEKL